MSRTTWSQFVERCTPNKWSLRVVSMDEGQSLATTMDFPDDRDIDAALGRLGAPAGRYRLSPKFKGKLGDSWLIERRLLRMATGEKMPSEVLALDAARALAPRDAQRPTGGLTAKREEAMMAELDAKKSNAEADTADARRRRAKAEREAKGNDDDRLTRILEALAPKPGGGELPAIVSLLVAQQKQSSDLLMAMLQQQRADAAAERAQLMSLLRDAAAAPPAQRQAAGDPVESIAKTLETIDRVRGLIRQDSEPRSELGEIADLAREFMAMRNGAPAPVAAAVRQVQVPAPRAAPPTHDLRVRQFVEQVIGEMANGSAPDAVADLVEDAIGLLPLRIRSGLDAGNWRDAWSACQLPLGPDNWNQVDAMIAASPELQTWCAAFAKACEVENGTDDGREAK